jgi:DNA-binding Xre family transcriptional regulator
MAIESKHVGSSFDDFLEEEGIYTETYEVATKRVLAWQIDQMMKKKGISKKDMASKMKTSRTSLRRLLDPRNNSVTLLTLDKAAKALGKSVKIEIVDTTDDGNCLPNNENCNGKERPAL